METLSPKDIKKNVLDAYDKYADMKLNDKKLIDINTKLNKYRQIILSTLGDKKNELNSDKLTSFDDKFQELEKERSVYLKSTLNWIYEYNPQLFEIMTSETPPPRELFENVLSAYNLLNKNKSNEFDLVKNNLEKLREKNGLPSDFFDWKKYGHHQFSYN